MAVSEKRPFVWTSFNTESPLIDAGGRLRVSQITSLIDVKQINDNAPLFLDRENVGGATQTYDQSKGGVEMEVASSADAAIVETKMFAPYFSGKSQLLELTFAKMQNAASVVKRAGYFSSNSATPFDSNKDGIWLEADGTEHQLVIQKNGTDVLRAPLSEWEEEARGIDFSNFNVLVIQFLYLGGTAIRFGFFIEGEIVWAYTYVHAGVAVSTFVYSPNQPIRYEIRSTGGAATLEQICCQASTEGQFNLVGVPTSFHSHDFQADVADTIYAVLGLRLRAATRNIRAILKGLSFQAEANDDFMYMVLLNPTLNGAAPTFGATDGIGTINDSILDVAIGATVNSVDAANLGLRIDGGSVQGGSSEILSISSSIHLGSNIDGTFDELWVCVRPRTAGLDVDVTANMQEYI